MKHLIKYDWKKISVLFVDKNKIGNEGFSILGRGNWEGLARMNICNLLLIKPIINCLRKVFAN
jgi:hypothetical protein